MIKQLLLIIILLGSTFSSAQKREIYRDNFNSNYRWGGGIVKEGLLNIVPNDGRLTLLRKKIPLFNPNSDFILEASVSLNNINQGGAYLIYGADENNFEFQYFSLEKLGEEYSVGIGKYIDGEWINVQQKTDTKEPEKQRILTIRRNDNTMRFYVDNIFIYKKDAETFLGNVVGLGVVGQQDVSFDYLVIKQDSYFKASTQKTEINLKKIGGVYEVPVELNGVLKIDFIFDSGASDVSISADVAMTLIKTGTIKEGDWLSDARYYFADGSSAKSKRFKLKSVKIGNKIVYDVVCSISNSLDAPMLLGQSVLSKFGRYTFDYKEEKLIIE